jgi:hypothetical protein
MAGKTAAAVESTATAAVETAATAAVESAATAAAGSAATAALSACRNSKPNHQQRNCGEPHHASILPPSTNVRRATIHYRFNVSKKLATDTYR